ncbi:MAG: hypothetical protein ACI4MK_12315 [Aristaeellaceae bacterium]
MDEKKYSYPYGGNPYPPRNAGPYPPQYPPQRQAFPPLQQPQLPQPGLAPTQNTDRLPDGTQILTGEGFKPLSRQEREEAARIAAEAHFSFDGYQVVRREFFSHKFDPTLTIRNNGIVFNNACISKLDEVVYVQVLINPDTGKLVVRPCDEGARDAVRWCIARDDKRKSRQISCSMFTAKLYDLMGWETLYRYKMQGTRISYQGEQLYVFDLTSTEVFIPATQDTGEPEGKPRKKTAVRFLENWRDSFGLPVAEHTASTQIDLNEGYGMMDAMKGESAEQMPMEMIDQETGEVCKV